MKGKEREGRMDGKEGVDRNRKKWIGQGIAGKEKGKGKGRKGKEWNG